MKLGIMRFLLLIACFGFAQTYFSEQHKNSLAHSLQGTVSTVCSATYAILISHVFGLLYLYQPFSFKIFAVVSELVQYNLREVLWSKYYKKLYYNAHVYTPCSPR